MKIAPIVLKLREAKTVFGQNIGGAIELAILQSNMAVKNNMAFVVQSEDSAAENLYDNAVQQIITEKFSVIVVLSFSDEQKKLLGAMVYDSLHTVRSQLFRAIAGWWIKGAESPISYDGGQLLPINPTFVWYQYNFKYTIRLQEYDGFCDLYGDEDPIFIADLWNFRDKMQVSQLPELQRIYTDYILSPSANIPYLGGLPVDSSIVDMSTIVNIADDKNPGAFDRAFGSGFDFLRILNRRNDPK